MSDRGTELVRKAVRALTDVEREDLLVELLLHRQAAAPGAGPAGVTPPRASPPDAERLAAVLGGPVDIGGSTAMKVLPIRLPEATHDRLRRFCASNSFSMAVVIRTLVERFLDHHLEAPATVDAPGAHG